MDDIKENPWKKARNLQDLCNLTTQWLEGNINLHFSQYAKPDIETQEILDFLIQFNQLGILTDFSQPAQALENGNGQRACVSGFSNEVSAKKLAALNLSTDLIIFIFEPGWLYSKKAYGYSIPITVAEYHPFTWCGSVRGNEIDDFTYNKVLKDEAISSIVSSWHIVAIDLKWGRKAYLWDTLIKTLSKNTDSNNKYSVKPYPEHKLGVKFVY